jgi:hypothetical protein
LSGNEESSVVDMAFVVHGSFSEDYLYFVVASAMY